MKKRMIAILIVAAMLLTACGETARNFEVLSGDITPIIANPLSTDESAAFIPSVSDLTVDIFQRAFLENSEINNLVSPLSVLLALAMTANGADSETLAEMEVVLGRGIELADLNRLLSGFVNNLPSGDRAKLNIANSIWIHDCESFTADEDFLQVNQNYYAAQIMRAAFDNSTVDDINAWVSRNTDDMITEIIDSIDPMTVMFLINAIVFDSEWEVPYEEHQVRDHDFTAFDGRVQTTDFMWSTERYFIETANATGFLKPYADGHYSFAAFLPNEDVDIADFIAGMTGESLMHALNSAERHFEGVQAGLPKFTFEYEISMNRLLSEMGMPTAFLEGGADFSRLGWSDMGNLFIDEVRHKTFIEVDEFGTRAAAVTSVDVQAESESVPDYKFVTLDRPFVFAIVDNATNLPIFIGALLEIPE